MFKRFRQNNKQSRPWSDCSLRSSLIWVCTVCSDLSVPILQVISVSLFIHKHPLTSGVSNICLTCRIFVICHVYLVNVPSGRASFLTKAVVKFGRRFFLFPVEILCWRHSKKNCGAWNTSGSGLPSNKKYLHLKKNCSVWNTSSGNNTETVINWTVGQGYLAI